MKAKLEGFVWSHQSIKVPSHSRPNCTRMLTFDKLAFFIMPFSEYFLIKSHNFTNLSFCDITLSIGKLSIMILV